VWLTAVEDERKLRNIIGLRGFWMSFLMLCERGEGGEAWFEKKSINANVCSRAERNSTPMARLVAGYKRPWARRLSEGDNCLKLRNQNKVRVCS